MILLLNDLNLYVLFALLFGFAIYSVKIAPTILSPFSYFHDDRPKDNVISLTAANITLGTGLFFHINGAQNNGILWVLIPISTTFGYYLLAALLPKVNIASREGKNFFSSINNQIELSTGKISHFSKLVTLSLIIIYTLILAYEIYASSSIISPLFFNQPSIFQQAAISFLVFGIAAFYAIFGGIKVVFRTDKIQIILVYVFIPALAIILIFSGQAHQVNISIDRIFKFNLTNLITVLLFCISAVATQFYNLLNWATVSHVKVDQQAIVFRKVGKRILWLLLTFAIIGMLLPQEKGIMIFNNFCSAHVYQSADYSIWASLISIPLVCGLTSIILTTIDSLIIAISMFYYDNFLNLDSKSIEENPGSLRSIRIISLLALISVFILLSIVNYVRPDFFSLLLVFAGAVVVYAPMIYTVAILSSDGKTLKAFNGSVIYFFFGLFITMGIAGLLFLQYKPEWLSYSGMVSLFLSSSFSIIVYRKSVNK